MMPAGRVIAKLRQPLLGLLASALLAGATTLWGNFALQDARRENAAARLRKTQMQEHLNQATAEAGNISARVPTFRQLAASGVVGEEARQQWTNMLENIGQERQPLDMNYELGAKTPLTGSNSACQGFATRLRLRAEFRHETDLLQLVARLEQEARALLTVQHCRLARAAGPLPGLHGSCEFDLITLQPAAQR